VASEFATANTHQQAGIMKNGDEQNDEMEGGTIFDSQLETIQQCFA
jgi:hypothetical protein